MRRRIEMKTKMGDYQLDGPFLRLPVRWLPVRLIACTAGWPARARAADTLRNRNFLACRPSTSAGMASMVPGKTSWHRMMSPALVACNTCVDKIKGEWRDKVSRRDRKKRRKEREKEREKERKKERKKERERMTEGREEPRRQGGEKSPC